MTNIVVVNASNVLTDEAVKTAVAALQKWDDNFLRSVWGLDRCVYDFMPRGTLPDAADRSVRPLFVNRHSTDPGALGWHDDQAGLIFGRLFAGDCLRYGISWTVDLSHEAGEMRVDPDIQQMITFPNGDRVMREVCLAGETEIPLTDGRSVSIADLAVHGAFHSRRTARNAGTVAVVFSDGSLVRCTPEHRFLLTDGRFTPASSLKSGDMLPRFSAADAVDRSSCYAIGGRHGLSASCTKTNFANFNLTKLARATGFSAKTPVADHPTLDRSVKLVPIHSAPMGRTETLCADRPLAAFDGAFHAKVVDRVEQSGNADVYDLTVPLRHNFATGAGVFVHNCDAVEDDSLGIVVDNVLLSDFVTPRYFGLEGSGGFDYQGKLSGPFPDLTAGGYMGVLKAGAVSWGQITAMMAGGPPSYRSVRWHQSHRRLRLPDPATLVP